MFIFVSLLLIMSIILNYRNDYINNLNKLNNDMSNFNKFNNKESNLYLCKKYCFPDDKSRIWLDYKIANQICKRDSQSVHTISKIACNDLTDNINTTQNGGIYNESSILNFCSAKIISSTINCSDATISFEFK